MPSQTLWICTSPLLLPCPSPCNFKRWPRQAPARFLLPSGASLAKGKTRACGTRSRTHPNSRAWLPALFAGSFPYSASSLDLRGLLRDEEACPLLQCLPDPPNQSSLDTPTSPTSVSPGTRHTAHSTQHLVIWWPESSHIALRSLLGPCWLAVQRRMPGLLVVKFRCLQVVSVVTSSNDSPEASLVFAWLP